LSKTLLLCGHRRLDYSIDTDANKKFINAFVSFHKIRCRETPGWWIQLQTEKASCTYQPDSNAACVSARNRFSLMLYNVVNYNDITFTSCSHKHTRKVRFT